MNIESNRIIALSYQEPTDGNSLGISNTCTVGAKTITPGKVKYEEVPPIDDHGRQQAAQAPAAQQRQADSAVNVNTPVASTKFELHKAILFNLDKRAYVVNKAYIELFPNPTDASLEPYNVPYHRMDPRPIEYGFFGDCIYLHTLFIAVNIFYCTHGTDNVIQLAITLLQSLKGFLPDKFEHFLEAYDQVSIMNLNFTSRERAFIIAMHSIGKIFFDKKYCTTRTLNSSIIKFAQAYGITLPKCISSIAHTSTVVKKRKVIDDRDTVQRFTANLGELQRINLFDEGLHNGLIRAAILQTMVKADQHLIPACRNHDLPFYDLFPYMLRPYGNFLTSIFDDEFYKAISSNSSNQEVIEFLQKRSDLLLTDSASIDNGHALPTPSPLSSNGTSSYEAPSSLGTDGGTDDPNRSMSQIKRKSDVHCWERFINYNFRMLPTLWRRFTPSLKAQWKAEQMAKWPHEKPRHSGAFQSRDEKRRREKEAHGDEIRRIRHRTEHDRDRNNRYDRDYHRDHYR